MKRRELSGYDAKICAIDDLYGTARSRKANARLIAAAPDLYEALEAIRDNEVVRAVCPSPLWAKMADALLKARGETA